jgi:hypothetical protein
MIRGLKASYLAIPPCGRPPDVPIMPSFGTGYVLARGEVDIGRRSRYRGFGFALPLLLLFQDISVSYVDIPTYQVTAPRHAAAIVITPSTLHTGIKHKFQQNQSICLTDSSLELGPHIWKSS